MASREKQPRAERFVGDGRSRDGLAKLVRHAAGKGCVGGAVQSKPDIGVGRRHGQVGSAHLPVCPRDDQNGPVKLGQRALPRLPDTVAHLKAAVAIWPGHNKLGVGRALPRGVDHQKRRHFHGVNSLPQKVH